MSNKGHSAGQRVVISTISLWGPSSILIAFDGGSGDSGSDPLVDSDWLTVFSRATSVWSVLEAPEGNTAFSSVARVLSPFAPLTVTNRLSSRKRLKWSLWRYSIERIENSSWSAVFKNLVKTSKIFITLIFDLHEAYSYLNQAHSKLSKINYFLISEWDNIGNKFQSALRLFFAKFFKTGIDQNQSSRPTDASWAVNDAMFFKIK